MGKSKIEWTDSVWNPITGCSHAGSPGCDHCYAKRMAQRLKGRYGYPKDNPFKVTFHPDRLNQPLRWEKPSRIFSVSMGDLFHEDVQYDWIDSIWSRIAKCPQHTFMVLTKRPKRMAEFISEVGVFNYDVLPNLWLGVTVESDKYLWRIKELLKIKSAVHFVSCEPLLSEIDFSHLPESGAELDWVIVGGESGPGARPMHPDWARSIRDQCQAAGVPFFFKQWGNWCPESGGYYDLKNVALFNDEQNGKQPIYLRDLEPDRRDNWDEYQPRDTHMYRVGKKKAGRILDGRTWDEYPERNNIKNASNRKRRNRKTT
jgi:protein gp37